jgi:glycosyltransferase involved in cell wall biosynthesis
MTAALYYHPEAYTTSGPKLMGRHAAGESFLRGFLAHHACESFWLQVSNPEHAQHFAEAARAQGRKESVRVVQAAQLGALAHAGSVYHPGPGIGLHAWQRVHFGHRQWSLCGITHTTSSAGAMDAIVDLITAPVQPWDALICTSTAVKEQVSRVLQAQVDHLVDRLGVSRIVLPQMPVIPLGVHTADFLSSPEDRAAARQELGLGPEKLAVLFMGRLSFHAKAHPLAMYQALELAVQRSGKAVVLIECGWHANTFIAKAFEEAARLACPSVSVVQLDGRKAHDRQTAWAAADLCASFSDNIQETFGIVPLEAMAAGLPLVVSDWNGYKDTVRHGIDGFRVPTLMPEAGLGRDLALRHALEVDSYDMYCGHSCSFVAVDVDAAAHAFTQLLESAQLRNDMGRAGQARAQVLYDWKAVIAQYERLWAQLAELRVHRVDENAQGPALESSAPRPELWPARMDPFASFRNYPSRSLAPGLLLGLVDNDPETATVRAMSYRKLAMIDFAKAVLPADAELRAVLQALAQGPVAVSEIVGSFAADRQATVMRSLVWMVKLHLIRPAAAHP